MSKRRSKSCAQWAEQLAQASFGHLAGEESAALKAHLIACPACAAARADYLYTATVLRQSAGPDPLPGLPPPLLQVWAAEAPPPAQRLARSGHLQEVSMQTIKSEIPPTLPPTPPTWRQRAGRRTVTAISALAAVLVIALVTTALVASHSSGKRPGTGAGQSPAATSQQTQQGNQHWKALPHLANLPFVDETLIAPGNARVVYQIVIGDQGTPAALRRSDDQGATWKNLPAPTGAAKTNSTQLYISPTNAQHVLAIIGIPCPSGQAAAAGALSTLSDGHTCSVLYFSSTGGESWSLVTLPAHSSHNLFLGSGIVAQENRLYAILFVDPNYTGSELVISRDDGATWQFADQGLDAEQHCLGSVAAPRSGQTLFTTTLPDCSGQTSSSESALLWRSGNAGAQWTRVSSLPATSAFFLRAVNVSSQAQPALIKQGALGPQELDFSLDSGKTWQRIPTLGDQAPGQGGIVGILNDGSMLEQARSGLFAWKAGDSSWHKVAPALAGTVLDSLVVSDQASGHETLYLEVRPDQGNSTSFYSIDLP